MLICRLTPAHESRPRHLVQSLGVTQGCGATYGHSQHHHYPPFAASAPPLHVAQVTFDPVKGGQMQQDAYFRFTEDPRVFSA